MLTGRLPLWHSDPVGRRGGAAPHVVGLREQISPTLLAVATLWIALSIDRTFAMSRRAKNERKPLVKKRTFVRPAPC